MQHVQPGPTKQTVELKQMGRGLKFLIYEVEGLYYLCSKNEVADQLCALTAKKQVFSRGGSLDPCYKLPAECFFKLPGALSQRYQLAHRLCFPCLMIGQKYRNDPKFSDR